MQVEVVGAGRSLEIALLERLAVPYAVCLVDIHVVHVDRDPHVAGGVGDLVVDAVVDDEVVRMHVAVLDEVYAGLGHVGEVELHIVVLVVGAPLDHLAGIYLGGAAVIVDPVYGGTGLGPVVLVKLDHGHLGLRGNVAYLREAHVGFPDPALDSVGLHRPAEDLAGLAFGKDAAQHEPAVLGYDASVIELEGNILGGDPDHTLGIVRCHEYGVSGLHGKRIDEAAGTPVVIGPVALVLLVLLAVGTGYGLADGIAGEAVGTAVHDIGLVPVLRRKELEVESRIAGKRIRNGLVEIDVDMEGLAVAGHYDP